MRLRTGLTALLVLAAAAAAPAAAKSDSARGPRIAGTTVVTATRPSVVRLYLPAPATVEWGATGSPNLTVTGDGRAVGAVLASGHGSTLVAMFVGDCAAPGCAARTRTPVFTFPDHLGSAVAHPSETVRVRYDPGWFDLYLLTDGAPVTATLTLPNLKGSTRVTARDAARLTWATPAVPAGLPVHAVSATGDVTANRGLAASAVVVATPVHVGGAAGVCWTREPGGTPTCEEADTTHHLQPASPLGRPFVYAAGHRVDRGRWTQRAHWATGPGTTATVVQLWLDLAR